MKNIHVLPTDKPSRLQLNVNTKKLILFDNIQSNNESVHLTTQNIYITSDEKPKKGEWVLFTVNDITEIVKVTTIINNAFETKQGFGYGLEYCQKIILTTDQSLNGVQAIDDEFLKWFVKNPSCEEVEANKLYYGALSGFADAGYKIIIPKEELNQIFYNTVGRENGVNVIKGQFTTQKEALDLANELNEKGLGVYYDWRKTLIKEEPKQTVQEYEQQGLEKHSFELEPKQETLEEAAERLQKDKYGIFISKEADVKGQLVIDTAKAAFLSGMIEGAKWQQERMYSEEDIREAFKQSRQAKIFEKDMPPVYESFDEWFEQFKKK